ncbi:ATPase, T2SS/T4P/T4SS family [Acidithiobacillus sp.]
MLQAMNTGHDGSLTIAHANSARDMLSRLEVMVLMAGMDLPLTTIREQIASAVDVIVQITRFSCGSRKVTSLCEVTGTESGTIQLQELFSLPRVRCLSSTRSCASVGYRWICPSSRRRSPCGGRGGSGHALPRDKHSIVSAK